MNTRCTRTCTLWSNSCLCLLATLGSRLNTISPVGSCCGRGDVSGTTLPSSPCAGSPKEDCVPSIGEGIALVAGCEMFEVPSVVCVSCSLAGRGCSGFPSGCLRERSSGSSCSTLGTTSFSEGIAGGFWVAASLSCVLQNRTKWQQAKWFHPNPGYCKSGHT